MKQNSERLERWVNWVWISGERDSVAIKRREDVMRKWGMRRTRNSRTWQASLNDWLTKTKHRKINDKKATMRQ